MSDLQSCYKKYNKMFFGYDKYSSVTNMFLELGLPTLDTLLFNCRHSRKNHLATCTSSNVAMHSINSIIN